MIVKPATSFWGNEAASIIAEEGYSEKTRSNWKKVMNRYPVLTKEDCLWFQEFQPHWMNILVAGQINSSFAPDSGELPLLVQVTKYKDLDDFIGFAKDYYEDLVECSPEERTRCSVKGKVFKDEALSGIFYIFY